MYTVFITGDDYRSRIATSELDRETALRQCTEHLTQQYELQLLQLRNTYEIDLKQSTDRLAQAAKDRDLAQVGASESLSMRARVTAIEREKALTDERVGVLQLLVDQQRDQLANNQRDQLANMQRDDGERVHNEQRRTNEDVLKANEDVLKANKQGDQYREALEKGILGYSEAGYIEC